MPPVILLIITMNPITRRHFISSTGKTAAAAALVGGIAPSILRGAEPAPEVPPLHLPIHQQS